VPPIHQDVMVNGTTSDPEVLSELLTGCSILRMSEEIAHADGVTPRPYTPMHAHTRVPRLRLGNRKRFDRSFAGVVTWEGRADFSLRGCRTCHASTTHTRPSASGGASDAVR
jgi:hypothetical protein